MVSQRAHYPLGHFSVPQSSQSMIFLKPIIRNSPILPVVFAIDRLHRQNSKKSLKNMCHVGMYGVGCPSVCCEYVLLPLVNSRSCFGLCRAE